MNRYAWGVLLLCATGVHAEPLNYDYAYLKSGESHVNGRSFRNDTFGAYYEVGQHGHLFGSYGDAGAYGNPGWKDSRALRLGVGGHWLVSQNGMLAVEVAGIRAQFESPARGKVRDTGWSTIVEYRYRFAPAWEAIATGTYTDVLGWQTSEFALGSVWHITEMFAVGAFYRRLDGNNGFDFTFRTYY